MKRIITLLVVLVLSLLLISCGTEAKETAATDQKASDSSVKVDENLVTVDITVPAEFYEDQDMTTFDPEQYAKDNEYKKVVVNDDGSVTLTMTKARHKALLKEMRATIDESYQELLEDTDIPYIESVDHDKNFTTVIVQVDRDGYDNAFLDMTPLMVGFQAMLYQTFAGEELHSEITMKYSDDGEEISTTVYPDDMQDDEEE